ncbi:DUF6929 family protein [Flavobacterium sp. N3904]|uniref:DUF6929 family protein n=1 Tax=Flavobacterium sp. N3904 TaxID=2986835 RepID=UPI002224CD40|nr:hypothetical protein [Flavobacterium sp. N3904]
MKKITLEILVHIIGLGSASGLIYNNDSLLLIGDSSGYLYDYSITKADLNKHQIIENPKENIEKNEKIDFESIAYSGDDLYIFGSGSGENRNKMIEINIKNNDTISTTDLTHLYSDMQSFAQIKEGNLNIEGAIYDKGNFFLLNRGNRKGSRNVIFTISGKNLINDYSILSNDFKLPKINGFQSGFSDAILIDDKIYFLATAENPKATTEDKRILGTLVGRIDVNKMKIDFTKKISNTQKFEGITLYAKSKGKVEFLLCEDNDTTVLESNIYKLTLEK